MAGNLRLTIQFPFIAWRLEATTTSIVTLDTLDIRMVLLAWRIRLDNIS